MERLEYWSEYTKLSPNPRTCQPIERCNFKVRQRQLIMRPFHVHGQGRLRHTKRGEVLHANVTLAQGGGDARFGLHLHFPGQRCRPAQARQISKGVCKAKVKPLVPLQRMSFMPRFLPSDSVTLRFKRGGVETEFQRHFYRTVIWRGLHLQAAALAFMIDAILGLLGLWSIFPWTWLFPFQLVLFLAPSAFSGWLLLRLYLDDRYYTRKVTTKQHKLRILGTVLVSSGCFLLPHHRKLTTSCLIDGKVSYYPRTCLRSPLLAVLRSSRSPPCLQPCLWLTSYPTRRSALARSCSTSFLP
jgi:hypothetical protein